MSIKGILRLSVTRSALSTLIVIVPVVIGLWDSIQLIFKAALIIVLGLVNFYLVYVEYRKPGFGIEEMLELMVKSIWGPENSAHFRSNVMLYNSKVKKLQIKYRYNMMGAIDRNFELAPKDGCAGRAYSSGVPFWVDILKSTHEKYYIDSGKVWRNMKSVMSIPILIDNQVKGVLNVDSDLNMNTAKLEEEKPFTVASAYSDLIAELLEKKV